MTGKKTSESVWIVAVVAVLLLVAVAGYFVVVSPQRGKASDLTGEVEATQKQIDDARALVAKAKDAQKVKIADIFKLTKAMPDSADEAGVLLDLNTIAEQSGIKFDSLAVDPSTTLANYQVIPLRLEFHGNFYAVADFLFRLRNLVDVRRGALDAHGRLFAIDKLALDEGVYVFPEIRAEITVVAFVYGAGVPATAAPPQSSSAASPTGTTTTTTATTTAPASSAAPNATAAGATP